MNTVDESITMSPISIEQKKTLLRQAVRQRQQKQQQMDSASKQAGMALSKGQQALWYIQQSAPESSAYHVASAMRVYSKVNIPQLEKALNFCIQRHPLLQARVVLQHGALYHVLDPSLTITINTVDASHLPEQCFKENIASDYHEPFDLSVAPLIRCFVYERSAESAVVMLVVHHVIFDAHSLWILMDELGACYEALTKRKAVTLQTKTEDYASYILQQQRSLEEKHARESLAYWLEKLHGDYRPLTLDSAKPRPKQQTYRGDSVHFRVPSEMSRGLKDYGRKHGVTVNTVLMAIFYCLLYRHSGHEDIVVMSPTAGRSDQRFARTIGYFVNPIAVRATLSGELSFSALLHQVQDALLEGIHHQHIPFASIVEALNPKRDPSYTPYSQFSFVFQQPRHDVALSQAWVPGQEGPRVHWAGLEVAQYPLNQQEGQFELEIEAVETAEGIVGAFKFNTDLFTVEHIQQCVGHYLSLLNSVLEADAVQGQPSPMIGALNMLTDAEQEQQRRWNLTDHHYAQEQCLHRLIEIQVEKTPSTIAVNIADNQLTYAQLNAKANQLAHYLLEHGVQLESKVVVFMNRSLEMVIALLAIIKAGAAYVPVDPNYPAKRVAFLIEDAMAPILLTQSDLVASLPEQARCLALDTLNLDHYSEGNLNLAIKPDHLAYMIYTSGSTGLPKGAMNTHAGICNRLLWMQDTYQLTVDDVVLQKTPFSFDVSVWEFFWPLMVGARLCVAKPEGHKDTHYLIETICQEKVTTIHFVPSMLSLFVSDKKASLCTSLKRVICSGEALSYQLQMRFFNTLSCELHNLYGPTEAAIDVSYWACKKEARYSFVPIGKPIHNIQLHILNPQGQPVPVGVCGELYIGGVGVARGYHQRESLTAEKFIRNPFSDHQHATLYKTGDLVRYLPDGNIEYLHRMDNQIKLRGFRIELSEVEAVLRQCPDICDAVVIKQDNNADEGYLVAYVTVNHRDFTTEDAIAFAQTVLPEHCVPQAIVVLDAMPLTPNGKVDLAQLPRHAYTRNKVAGFHSPRSEAERQLMSLWQGLLKVDFVSIDDNFFSLGGHSLLAVKMMADIEARFGKHLPLSVLMQNPTIKSLAHFLESSVEQEWDRVVRIQTQGYKTPMFFIPGGGGNVLYYYALAEQLGNTQPFYAIQAKGLDGKTTPSQTLQAWAESAVDAILKEHPNGPFIIGGHCVGALIAYEVAQILLQAGKTVERLIILDAPAPHTFVQKKMDIRFATWISLLVQAISHMIDKEIVLDENQLNALSEKDQLEVLKAKLVSLDVVTPTMSIAHIQGLLSVFIANAQLYYQPHAKPMVLPISLIRAAVVNEKYDYRAWDDEHFSLGWQAYAQGDVTVTDAPGDHITMLSPAHAAELARCF